MVLLFGITLLSVMMVDGTSTSTLKTHLKTEHSIELIINKDPENNNPEKLPKVKHGRSNNDDITELLLDWIIDDKQAFRVEKMRNLEASSMF